MTSRRVSPAMFDTFDGLKNTTTEERLGPRDLAVAENVDIDDAGQVRRRRGITLAAAGNYHSLFSHAGTTYVVKDGDLCVLHSNYSTGLLKAGVGSDYIDYAPVGDTIYFSSESDGGVIDGGAVRDWGRVSQTGEWWTPVVNPTANLPEVAGKLVGDPPRATSLAYLNGRIYLAQGQVLWATELYLYELIDRTKNYLYFEDPITCVRAVTDGLYVGTERATYFLQGPFAQMQRRKVVDSGAIRGSMIVVEPDMLGEQARGSNAAVMFLTPTGLCVGLDGGVCFNLTRDKFRFPAATNMSALFRDQDGMSQYVGVANNSGEPTGKARFGDRVDVEIRRFQET